jgi:hypothetical protein
MNTDCADPNVEIVAVPEDDAWAAFDRQARRLLQMSGGHFIECWEQGKFSEDDDPRVTRVAMLMPSAW